MSRKMRTRAARPNQRQRAAQARCLNKTQLIELLRWVIPLYGMFTQDKFHGNVRWDPTQLVAQALIWSWQETRYVVNAFEQAVEVCEELGYRKIAKSYTSLMNALERYDNVWMRRIREQFQALAREVGGRHFRFDGWVLIAFDGSRTTTPRTKSNEQAFCAPHYGHGTRAKYGKKKSKGLRRKRILQHPTHPQAPQVWVTMMWHMGLRLPWTWRLGRSNASERNHVTEILSAERFPEKTLFCGDAGFVGYPLWQAILELKRDFVVRVGGNVSLLYEQANVKRKHGGIVLCWPKDKRASGAPPLKLRLVKVRVGKTKMWLLTSVLDERQLTRRQLVRIYQMRWGVEVEFRGLKQTIDKHHLRCRNSDRVLVEMNWSLCGMAIAELLALREQLAAAKQQPQPAQYEPRDRSLANTMRALRKSMRTLHKRGLDLRHELSQAKVQRYHNRTDKRARYRPANPDKKPLGEPCIRKISASERRMLKAHLHKIAA